MLNICKLYNMLRETNTLFLQQMQEVTIRENSRNLLASGKFSLKLIGK